MISASQSNRSDIPEDFFERCKTTFAKCFHLETGRPGSPNAEIARFATDVVTKLKLHTFFLPENLADITQSIFTNVQIRSFVFCLRDRFIVELNGIAPNIHEELINILADYGDINSNFGLPESKTLSLIPKNIPASHILGMSGSVEDFTSVMTNNSFLLIPIMIYLAYDLISIESEA